MKSETELKFTVYSRIQGFITQFGPQARSLFNGIDSTVKELRGIISSIEETDKEIEIKMSYFSVFPADRLTKTGLAILWRLW